MLPIRIEPRAKVRATFWIFAFLLSLAFAWPGGAPANAQAAGEVARVATEQLNMRSGPGTANPVIHKMHEGTRVKILARRDGWAQLALVDNPAVTGWASARYLDVLPASFSPAAEAYFADLIATHGAPRGQGYIAELETHFVYFCNNGFGLALFREDGGAGRGWASDDWCVRDVMTRDIDGDGDLEIIYFSAGGGTGSFGVKERHLYWPAGAAEPARGYDYFTLAQSQGMAGDTDMMAQWEERREMRYGEGCRDSVYTPDWPRDALSRPVVICALSEEKTIQLMGVGNAADLHGNAAIEAFVKTNAARGFELVGARAPAHLKALSRDHLVRSSAAQGEALENLSLGSLDAVDTGERVELSKERKAMIAEWLN